MESGSSTIQSAYTGSQSKYREWSSTFLTAAPISHYMGSHSVKSIHSTSRPPSQVFLFLVNTLLRKLLEVPADKWSRVFVAYDNMCNLDGMTVAKKELHFQFHLTAKYSWIFNCFYQQFHCHVVSHLIDCGCKCPKSSTYFICATTRNRSATRSTTRSHWRKFIQTTQTTTHKLVNKRLRGLVDFIKFY